VGEIFNSKKRLRVFARRQFGLALKGVGLRAFARKVLRAIRSPGITCVKPRLLRMLPHDLSVHTQGLVYADGRLYESTGLVGKSSLRTIDIHSGEVVDSRRVIGLWAEGIAARDNRLVQLTYTEQFALIYRLPDLKEIGHFQYQGEGWGLAAYRDGYVMSDGTDNLSFRNVSFETVRRLRVHLAGRPLAGINDLVVAYGKIYANVVLHNYIYEISPHTGQVLRIIDCTEVVDLVREHYLSGSLNGIAFVPGREVFLITGKNWPSIFEVEWPP
jgi:glutamine cyclotransferase